MATPKIQHSGNSVYAVLMPDGPAVYPSLESAILAVLSDTVQIDDGDREYYDARTWHDVPANDLAEWGIGSEARA